MSSLDKAPDSRITRMRVDARPAPPPESAASSGSEPDPEEAKPLPIAKLIHGAWRRRWTVVLFALLGVVGGLLVSVVRSDRYRSHGIFLFDRGGEQLNIAPFLDASTTTGIVGNFPFVLMSRELCERVVDRVGIEKIIAPYRTELVPEPDAGPIERARTWFTNLRRRLDRSNLERMSKGDVVAHLQGSLDVHVPNQSSVLIVSYSAPEPIAAREVLDVFMDEAIKWHLEVYSDEPEIRILEADYEEAQGTLDAAVEAFDSFMSDLGVPEFERAVERRRVALESVQDRLQTAEAAVATQTHLGERLSKELDELDPTIQLSEIVAREDPRLRWLEESIETRTKELVDLKARYKTDDPAIRIAQQALDALVQQLSEARSQRPSEFLQTRTVENPRYKALQDRLFDSQLELETNELLAARLREDLEVRQEALNRLSTHARQHDELTRAVTKARSDLDNLERQMERVRAKQSLKQNNLSTLSIMQRPLAGERETPSGMKIMSAALGVGLMGGLGLALLLSFIDRVIRTPSDLEEVGRAPLLASYPRLTRKHLGRHIELRDRGC